MRISDWSSDVCSSDLEPDPATPTLVRVHVHNRLADGLHWRRADFGPLVGEVLAAIDREGRGALVLLGEAHRSRSEEHTSELQSLMRISYAVFCLKKKKTNTRHEHLHAVYHITQE